MCSSIWRESPSGDPFMCLMHGARLPSEPGLGRLAQRRTPVCTHCAASALRSARIALRRSPVCTHCAASEPGLHALRCVGARSARIALRRSPVCTHCAASDPSLHALRCVGAGSARIALRRSRSARIALRRSPVRSGTLAFVAGQDEVGPPVWTEGFGGAAVAGREGAFPSPQTRVAPMRPHQRGSSP
jgi:hypothetical protein